MTRQDMLNIMYNWAATEIPIALWIFADQNEAPFDLANNPDGIGVIKLLSSKDYGRGYDELTYNVGTDNFDEEILTPREFVFSFNIYGPNSFDFADQLQASIYRKSVANLFNTYGVGYISQTQVRDLTSLVSAKFEQRAQFDITFNVETSYTKAIDRMVQISVKGDIDDGRLTTNQQFNL